MPQSRDADALQPDLTGKVALVTGASRGIGRAIALRLGALGAHVALAGRDQAALDEVVASLPGTGDRSTTHIADISARASAVALVQEVHQAHGNLDVVINNAGGSVPGSLIELDDAAWSDALELKLLGGMRVARAAWPLLARSRGSLINIVGVAGWTADPRGIVAATQCAGAYAMTKAIAALGLQDGVQVNAINPGPVWTARLKARLESLGVDAALPENEILSAVAAKYGVRRIARPEDIANLVAFVLTPSGGMFHGSLIDFDGGAVRGL